LLCIPLNVYALVYVYVTQARTRYYKNCYLDQGLDASNAINLFLDQGGQKSTTFPRQLFFSFSFLIYSEFQLVNEYNGQTDEAAN
jgi:hypothetical protein